MTAPVDTGLPPSRPVRQYQTMFVMLGIGYGVAAACP
jgi:hypothetical protein